MQNKLSLESELRKYRNLTQSQIKRNFNINANTKINYEDKITNSPGKKNTESTRTPESEKENQDRIFSEQSDTSSRTSKQSFNKQNIKKSKEKQNKVTSQPNSKYNNLIQCQKTKMVGSARRTQSNDSDFSSTQSPQEFKRNLSQQSFTQQNDLIMNHIKSTKTQKEVNNEQFYQKKYIDLKNIHKSCQQEFQIQQKTIDSLKEQNIKLKMLNKSLQKQLENQKSKQDKEDFNRKIQDLVNQKKKINIQNQASLKESKAVIQNQVESKLAEKLQLSKQKCIQLQQELIKLKEENNKLKHFKGQTSENCQESSSLAEQLICLRSDLDRSHSQCLRLIRSNMSNNLSSYVKGIAIRQDSFSKNNSLVNSFESKETFSNYQNQENEENDNLVDVLRQYGIDLHKSPQKL